MTKLWRFFMISIPLVAVMLLSLTQAVEAATTTQSVSAFRNSVGTLTCNSWCVVPSGNASTANNFLRGVAVVSPNNAWAVGYYMSQYNQTLIEHYDGNSWKVFSSPSPGNADNRLFGVVALSANNIWAVGTYDIMYQPAQSLIEHFNGTSWTVVRSPSPNSFDVELYSVAAASANNIWAVGYYATSNTTTSILIEHYDGSSWQIVSSPSRGSAYNYLRSVTAVSASNIWAVGISSTISTSTPPQTLIEHYDGKAWKVFASPSPGSANNQLYGVTAVSASNIWTVGMQAASNGPAQTLVEHFNGTNWTVVSSPNSTLTGSYSSLNGVVAVSANNIWAVGNVGIMSSGAGTPIGVHGPSNGTTPEPTLIEHYNGKSWQIVSSASPGANANVLEAAARVPGTTQVWTVGYEFMTYGPTEAAQTLIEFHS